MAICIKCNNQFYSKECPHCKKIVWEDSLNKNNKHNHHSKPYIKSHKTTNSNYSNKKHANFAIRFLASMIDTIIIAIPFALMIENYMSDVIVGVITVVFWILMKGQTPGKKLLKIKIVDENYNDISAQQAVFRYVGYFISIITFFIGFAIIAFRKDHKGIHDMIANTYVIHLDKEKGEVESDTTDKILSISSIFFGILMIIGVAVQVQQEEQLNEYKKFNEKTMKMNSEIIKQMNETMKHIGQGFKPINVNK